MIPAILNTSVACVTSSAIIVRYLKAGGRGEILNEPFNNPRAEKSLD
jgi:hypothetical protein